MPFAWCLVLGAVLGPTDPVAVAGIIKAVGLPATLEAVIVGESLFNVAYAGLIVATGKDSPLALVGEGFEAAALPLGIVAYVAATLGLYAWTERRAARLG